MEQDIRLTDHTENKKDRRIVYQDEIGVQVRKNHSLSEFAKAVQEEETAPDEASEPTAQPERQGKWNKKHK